MRKLLAILFFCLIVSPAAAFTKVQGSNGAAFGPSLTQTCVFGGAVTSGNFVWGAFVSANVGTDAITVTDDKSNTYNVSALGTDGSGAPGMVVYWLGNVTNAPTTITITNNNSRSNLVTVCEEWSGVNSATDPKDVAPATPNIQATPGTGANGITSTGVTTVTNGDLLLGATANRTNTTCPGTAGTSSVTYTLQTVYNAAITCLQLESGTQTTAGSGTVATYTQASANPAITAMLAVKAPGGGGGGGGSCALSLLNVGC